MVVDHLWNFQIKLSAILLYTIFGLMVISLI